MKCKQPASKTSDDQGNTRKVIVSMNLTLDGYLSGPNGELDWHFEYWNEEMSEKLLQQLDKADTILLGRLTYEAMSNYWQVKPLEKDFPRQDLAIADLMNSHVKVVFSKTRSGPVWNNSILTIKAPEEVIKGLKQQKGRDIILYGSASIAYTIIRCNLADEYRLWIHPVILGSGNPLFKNLKNRIKLKLTDAIEFDSGVVVCSYKVVR
ncbi:MAG: dihydrofolate reductase family protein [Bacteroidota bacterium]|nr:dihydrofolate reductase family protein [Bacteroidota bacterium]